MRLLTGIIRGLGARWQKQREMEGTYQALRSLDTRTLRDLGIHRSEIRSIATEIAGEAARERLIRS